MKTEREGGLQYDSLLLRDSHNIFFTHIRKGTITNQSDDCTSIQPSETNEFLKGITYRFWGKGFQEQKSKKVVSSKSTPVWKTDPKN